MDIATIIGLILGFAVMMMAMILGGGLTMFIEPISLIVVVIGSIAATLTAFPLKNVLGLPKVLLKSIFVKPSDLNTLIKQLVKLAEVARRDGILSLESHLEEVNEPFIVQGVQMAVDGTDPDLIEQILEQDLENEVERHDSSKKILTAIGTYAPAFGMIGTLIGLVAMLQNMDDPSGIGAGMAVALLTTLYGAVISNVIFLPLADKLALRSDEEAMVKLVIIKGVMSIQAGDNPRVVEQKLSTFLPLRLRGGEKNDEESSAKAAA